MGRIQAAIQLDSDRAPEQLAYLRERVTILREAGAQLWVSLEESQVGLLEAAGLEVHPRPEGSSVQLPALVFRPLEETPEPPPDLAAQRPVGADEGYFLVAFRAPIDRSWLDDIARTGGEFMQAVPEQAAVFRFSGDEAAAIGTRDYVIFLGSWHPAYAVSPQLAGAEEPFTAPSLRNMVVSLPPEAPEGNLTLRAFDALDPEELREPLVAAGAEIIGEVPQGFRVDVPAMRVLEVLRVPGIAAAEPPAVTGLLNNNAGVIVGANQVRTVGTVNFLVNLDGRGEVGAVVDSGFDVGNRAGAVPPATVLRPAPVFTSFHPDLVTNVRMLRNRHTPAAAALAAPDAAPHGTHVAGTVAGDGSASAGRVRGMAPAASLIALGAPFTAVPPMNIVVALDFAFAQGARVINNSWGTTPAGAVPSNNAYTADSRTIDRWCFAHPDVLVLFAAGNAERDVDAGGDGVLDARRMTFEATAKNALTVGASENLRNNGGWRDSYQTFFGARYLHAGLAALAAQPAGAFSFSDNADQVALFSDRGRVQGLRRVKPDVVAPGTNILSCRSQWVELPAALPAPPIPAAVYNANNLFETVLPAGISRNQYMIDNGTSMATPVVSGAALLVRQFYRTRFAQLRRPLLLEGVLLPAAAPLPTFGNAPSIAPHADGVVLAWITPELPANPKRIVAMRTSRRLASVDAAPVPLQTAVGDHPAPRVATRGDLTCLLHRHGDGSVRLSCYDRALQLVNGFGTAGVVTVAATSRSDDAVPLDLRIDGEHVVCSYPAAVGASYRLQRFRFDTGAAVDASAIDTLDADHTGPHGAVAFTGTRHTVCGVSHPGNFQLRVRQVATDGQLVGAAPITLLDQAGELRDPSIVWDPRGGGRHVMVWCDARLQAGGELFGAFLDANGAIIGAPALVMSAPPTAHMRRPRILPHPTAGYALVWEDDTQGATFDLYLALLDDALQPDGRLAADAADPYARRLLRISDTPDDTAGFAALADASGLALLYQSPDEINSDRLGVYVVGLTPRGAFESQEEPGTPMLRSGQYVSADLHAPTVDMLRPMSAVWAGGAYYVLRLRPTVSLTDDLEWVRLDADGRIDGGYGVNGVRAVPAMLQRTGCDILWIGTHLVSASVDVLFGVTLYLHDQTGAPVATFGAGGAAALLDPETFDSTIPPQVGSFTDAGQLRIAVAYGTQQAPVLQLRYQRVDDHGAGVGAPINLAVATGVATHGWFQFVTSETRAIAVYHRAVGPVTRVYLKRFRSDGTMDGVERGLSAAAGEALNAVVARRPTVVSSRQREYAAVWQYRAVPADKWEIRFSRLDRTGQPMANPAAPAPAITDVAVVTAGAEWPADRDAVEPQLVSTYTHEPVAHPPFSGWTPSYGLAWIGVHPDGSRVLFFTALDANGARLQVPQPPPVARGPLNPPADVPILQISATGSRVRNFKLVWNGRVFLLVWMEETTTGLRQRSTMVTRHASQRAFDAPSAALLRATLVNGATNISQTALPNVGTGYGWGRVNLRQSLSPAPPVTMLVRDDCAVGPGCTATYRFTLPPGTALLRVTLNWTDPPGASLVNRLHLTLRAPASPAPPFVRPTYFGNLWDPAPGRAHLSRAVGNPPGPLDRHEDQQTYKQVVLASPPTGDYEVSVSAEAFAFDPFNPQNLQAFALVVLGSGREVRFHRSVGGVQSTPRY